MTFHTGIRRRLLISNFAIIYLLLLRTAIWLSPGGSSPTLIQTKIKITKKQNKIKQNTKIDSKE
jgi:hypothetical protein